MKLFKDYVVAKVAAIGAPDCFVRGLDCPRGLGLSQRGMAKLIGSREKLPFAVFNRVVSRVVK